MCVIIVKPAGVKMPPREILDAAHSANQDGCGFVSTFHHKKTLSYRTFLHELSKVKQSEACIIHFRLATHGSVRTANCHPFRRGDVFFAHNGILDIRPAGDMTDSETAFARYIYPAIVKYGYDDGMKDYVISGIIGFSKFAMMRHGDVKVNMYGDFIKQPDGCYYSNLRFRWLINNHQHKLSDNSLKVMK